MLQSAFSTQYIEAGCDEAGRGCLAGPVTAAAVIFPKTFTHPLLNDSKQLTKRQRNALKETIKEEALCYAIASVSPAEIDEINILNASFLAMHRAIAQLSIKPELLLIDGNRFKPYQDIKHQCIIKGDGKFLSIAAASILAKTTRDDIMVEYAKKYPHYKWEQNMGYPTTFHREAIVKHGITPLHRKSFKLYPTPTLF